jgi:hypothetical protein
VVAATLLLLAVFLQLRFGAGPRWAAFAVLAALAAQVSRGFHGVARLPAGLAAPNAGAALLGGQCREPETPSLPIFTRADFRK